MKERQPEPGYPMRLALVSVCLCTALGTLLWRVVDLQINDRAFLQGQGDARVVRTEPIPGHRGMIVDRRGEPLAVSTTVASIWADPSLLDPDEVPLGELAASLEMAEESLRERVRAFAGKRFVYLRRHMQPAAAERVMELGVPGVSVRREYRRFYPAAEVAAHVVGITDIDDRGQEGLELAYEQVLAGTPGAKQVVKDRRGRVVRRLRTLRAADPGEDLQTTIDLRIQYFAYRELKSAVRQHRARGGSMVLIDVPTGEILAMVNQPSFNPNDRRDMKVAYLRNRAITDSLEPGSTVKPFTVAAALATGRYHPATLLNTSPGHMRVDGKTVRDHRDYGMLDIRDILAKSSNVGITRLALDIGPQRVREVFGQVGFGESTGTGYPGEDSGMLPSRRKWKDIQTATLSFGYGLSATPLQIAQAYATLAAGGVRRPVSLVRAAAGPEPWRVMEVKIANRVLGMLENVTEEGGTGTRAGVSGYRVAGKTGTVHKVDGKGGYAEDDYVAMFAGVVPASRPRLAGVVVIDGPRGEKYYGGEVAAPVFARIMGDALRILNVPPDAAGNRLVRRGTEPVARDKNADA